MHQFIATVKDVCGINTYTFEVCARSLNEAAEYAHQQIRTDYPGFMFVSIEQGEW